MLTTSVVKRDLFYVLEVAEFRANFGMIASTGKREGAEMVDDALEKWIAAYPDSGAIPFHLRPPGLYTVTDLYDTYDPDVPGSWNRTYDHKAFDWFIDKASGKPRKLSIGEPIAARLHDAIIEDAVDAFIRESRSKVVGFMGGHDVSRGVPAYRQVAVMARTLRRGGLQVVTGGGPGLME